MLPRLVFSLGPFQEQALVSRIELQIIIAVHRLDADLVAGAVLLDGERNFDPGRALRPELAVESGEIADLLASDRGDDAAAGDARALRRALGGDAGDDESPADLLRVDAEPRMRRGGW